MEIENSISETHVAVNNFIDSPSFGLHDIFKGEVQPVLRMCDAFQCGDHNCVYIFCEYSTRWRKVKERVRR